MKPIVVITGVSKGIGCALAEQLSATCLVIGTIRKENVQTALLSGRGVTVNCHEKEWLHKG